MKTNFLLNMTPNYEFDDSKLNEQDKTSVKILAKAERAPYGVAPIGRDIFSLMNSKDNLKIIHYDFNKSAKNIDAMIYKYPNSKNTWILINKNRPLIHQIFALAHEYYHFKKDIPKGIDGINCDFHSTNLREIKANRFAAELLLPTEAINNSIDNIKIKNEKLDKTNYLYLIIELSSRYCIPFDLCHFRIQDEKLYETEVDSNFFKKNENIINNYLKEIDPFVELLSNKNNYILNDNVKLLQKLFIDGNITESDFVEMAKDIDLSENFINSIIEQKDIQENNEDIDSEEDELFKQLRRQS
ncbi:MAG: ImmA/IrrE family metallo-endopeptidase [Pleomorphochaeta sp.]